MWDFIQPSEGNEGDRVLAIEHAMLLRLPLWPEALHQGLETEECAIIRWK